METVLVTAEDINTGDAIITHIGDVHVGYIVLSKDIVDPINDRTQYHFICERGKKFYLLNGNMYLIGRARS